ncbi:MAG: serine hydrolase domain-containing protein [Dokdonia sp.]|jgi:CubicO group peptidase (beta-lactamase class C family)
MKNHSLVFSLAAIIVFLVGCKGEGEKTDIDTLLGPSISHAKTDAFIDQQMRLLDMPALSIAVINDGKLVYHRVKGMANKAQQLPANSQAIFEAASISKSVFGHFVMTFVEEGLLDLDTPLYQYLPYPDIAQDERYKKITARMVLSHRSGFPNWRDDYPDKQLFIQFEPGSQYHYSGEGYQYLAKVLKHLLNTDWAGLEKEFQQRVAQPFGMKHSKFIPDPYIKAHKVQGYDKHGQWVDKYADPWWASRDTVFVAPTTLHTEAVDFSKWMIAIMQEQGLTEESYAQLFAPQSLVRDGFLSEDYTLGFSRLSILGLSELYTHSGNNTGFSSYFALDRDRKWGFVFFTNSKAGDQFALNLTYDLLLAGTTNKQLTIIFSLTVALLLWLFTLPLLFKKTAPLRTLRRRIFLIGLAATLGIVLQLFLMLWVKNTTLPKLYYVLFLILLLVVCIRTLFLWPLPSDESIATKIESVVLKILLVSLCLSSIALALI